MENNNLNDAGEYLRTTVKGLKCDNPDCDYADMDIKVEDYLDYIDYPCPKCGESLLTQEAYDKVQQLLEMADTLNDGLKMEFGEFDGKLGYDISLDMSKHGDCKVKDVKLAIDNEK